MGQPLRRVSTNGARSDDVLGQLPAARAGSGTPWPAERGHQRRPVRLGRRGHRCPARPDRGSRPARAPTGWWCPRALCRWPGSRAAARSSGTGSKRRAPALAACGRDSEIAGASDLSRSGAACRQRRSSPCATRRGAELAATPTGAATWRCGRDSGTPTSSSLADAAGRCPAVGSTTGESSPRRRRRRRPRSSGSLRRPTVPGCRGGELSAHPPATRATATAHRARPTAWARCTCSRSTEAARSTVNAG